MTQSVFLLVALICIDVDLSQRISRSTMLIFFQVKIENISVVDYFNGH
jgi:hypothetical protein